MTPAPQRRPGPRRAALALLLGVSPCSLGGCEELDLPPVVESSEVLSLAASPDREVCAGTFAHMDARVRALQDELASSIGP